MTAVLPIDTIDRVCLVVNDHRRAVEQLSRFFGVRRWEVWERSRDRLVNARLDGADADFAYVSAIGSVGRVGFEVIEPLQGESGFSRFLDWHGPGLSHAVVSGAGSFAANAEAIKAAGIAVEQQMTAGAYDQYLLDTRARLGGLAIMLEEDNDRTERRPETIEYDFEPVLPVQDLYQISVIVKDRDAAKRQFDEVLGISHWVDIGIDTEQGVEDATYYGKPADQAASIAIGRTGGACIEVVQHLRGDTVYRDVIEKHGEAPHHIMCTLCPPEQYQRAVAAAAAMGIEVSQGATIPGLMGFGYLDGRASLAGLFVEVITPLADNWLELMFPGPELARVVVGDHYPG